MNRLVFFLLALTFAGLSSCTENKEVEEIHTTDTALHTEEQTPQKMLRHVVLFKFKDTSAAESIDSIENAFRELPEKIKEIKGFEWGTDVSVENLQQGFTHCFFVSFENEEGRAVYLPHPAHQAFVGLATPHIDKVLVVDYFSEK
jgi:hypothetical protein